MSNNTTTNDSSQQNHKGFKALLYEHLYRNRTYWVDAPWILLTYMTIHEFTTHGQYVVPPGMNYACYGLLALYISIKTTVKVRHRQYYQRRWGGFFAMIWLVMMCVMWVTIFRKPDGGYVVTGQAYTTLFVVVGTYVGAKYLPWSRWSKVITAVLKGISDD